MENKVDLLLPEVGMQDLMTTGKTDTLGMV
jgi:hypothetical protein